MVQGNEYMGAEGSEAWKAAQDRKAIPTKDLITLACKQGGKTEQITQDIIDEIRKYQERNPVKCP